MNEAIKTERRRSSSRRQAATGTSRGSSSTKAPIQISLMRVASPRCTMRRQTRMAPIWCERSSRMEPTESPDHEDSRECLCRCEPDRRHTAFLAASLGNVEAARALVRVGADPFMTTEKGTAPVHVASWGGSPYFRDWTEDEKKNLFEMTKLLVELGADVNSAGEHGWTALHGAAYKGVDSVVQFLVDRGARMDVFDMRPDAAQHRERRELAARTRTSKLTRRPQKTSDLLLKLGATPLSESGVQILDLFYKQQ